MNKIYKQFLAVFSLYYIENLFTPPSTWEQALSTIDFEGELAFKFNILNDSIVFYFI